MTKIIAIAGPPCAGKTMFSRALYEKIQHTAIIYPLERDYKSLTYAELQDPALVNFEVDTAFDLDMTQRTLEAIKRGKKEIFLNTYDRQSKLRGPKERIVIGGSKQYRRPTGPTVYIDELSYVIVEGMYALHNKILPLVDLGIFLDIPLEYCYDRRLEQERTQGRFPEDVHVRWSKQIIPAYRDHVLPTKTQAQLVFQDPTTVATVGLAQVFEKLGINPGISYEW